MSIPNITNYFQPAKEEVPDLPPSSIEVAPIFQQRKKRPVVDQEKIVNKQKSSCEETHPCQSHKKQKKKVNHQHLQGYDIGMLLRYSRMRTYWR